MTPAAPSSIFQPRPPAKALNGGSVFAQLRLVLITVFALGSAVALFGAGYFSNNAANEAYDQLLISAAVQIAETVHVEDGAVTVAPPDAAFETLALSKDDRVFYAVRTPSGQLITGYDSVAPASGRPSELPRLSDVRVSGVAVRRADIARYVTSAAPDGWYAVTVAQTREARHGLTLALMIKMSSLILAVSVLGYWAALSAARRALRPLARIESALDARDPHDVSPLGVDSPVETRALVEAINQVMARLANRMDRLQKFAAIAAHQIRTPLSAVAAQLELLETDRTSAQRKSRIARIQSRVAELGRLTQQLLGHAMVLYRHDIVARERFDLVPLARRALDDGVPLTLERDLSVRFAAEPPSVVVLGDSVAMREGLTNLVHNAALHGAVHLIEVKVEETQDACRVTVSDDGPGIPAERWDLVLSPFASAQGHAGGASTGLGLSIAQEVARSHGGQVRFAADNRRFHVIMDLPRSASS